MEEMTSNEVSCRGEKKKNGQEKDHLSLTELNSSFCIFLGLLNVT